MTQILASSKEYLTDKGDCKILCCYVNITRRIQIMRIENSQKLHLERVVFPSQRLMFEALPEDQVEIYLSETASYSIPCKQLSVTKGY